MAAKGELTLMDNANRGFSLIEVLVALVVLVIGLIGVFNLHTVSKRSSFESFQQTQASYYAHDIVNRMKLNKSLLIGYNGTYSGKLSAPAKACVGAAVICSNNETRLWDLYSWEQLLVGASEKLGQRSVGGLDSPTACIESNANGNVQVVITWRGIRKLSDGAKTGSSYIKGCGDSDKRRRVYVINTVIL